MLRHAGVSTPSTVHPETLCTCWRITQQRADIHNLESLLLSLWRPVSCAGRSILLIIFPLESSPAYWEYTIRFNIGGIFPLIQQQWNCLHTTQGTELKNFPPETTVFPNRWLWGQPDDKTGHKELWQSLPILSRPQGSRVPVASISKEHSVLFNSVNQVKFPVMALVALVSLLGGSTYSKAVYILCISCFNG